MPGLRAAAATAEIAVANSLALGGNAPANAAIAPEAPFRAAALLVVGDAPICIVSCDVMALTRDLADEAARGISEACGVPFDNVLITATHTHHAPSTLRIYGGQRDEEFCRRTVAAAIDAARQAKAKLDATAQKPNECEAELLFALGQEATVGENSRWLMDDGQISWTGHQESARVRPTAPHDPDLPVLALRRPSGELVGALFGHGTHNIGTLNPRPGLRSPGFFGLAAQELERQHNAPFLFVPGAFGSSHRRDSLVKAPEAFTRVVNAVNEALGRLRPALVGPVAAIKRPYACEYRRFDEAVEAARVSAWVRRWLEEKRAAALEQTYSRVRHAVAEKRGETFETWLQVLRLGEVALVGIPGEMFAALGLEIRCRSPFRHTIVIGLANDEIGYIPDRRGHEQGGYQTWFCGHSQVEPGTGEAMVEAALSLLHEVHDGPPPAEARMEPLTADDAAALQQFYNGLDAQARRLFRPNGWNMTHVTCVQIGQDADAGKRFDLVLRGGKRIVGWAFLVKMDSDTPGLGIGLADAWRGKGYGRQLMERLIAEAKRRGKKAITLIHVKQNEAAGSLYRGLGFQVTGERRGSDGNDYFQMKLTL